MRKTLIFLCLAGAATAAAQSTETPVAFDSAQRVVAVTPAVAERFKLVAPAWPVSGVYREARLYSVAPEGGFVLVVQLPTGAFQRFVLTADERSALGAAIDAAMRDSRRPSSEAMSEFVSEPAGNAFARHQTLLAAAVYAPLMASLADDGAVAGGTYLATTGLAFFVSYGAAQSTPFTRAQSDLAAGLGLASTAGAILLGYSVTGDADKPVRAMGVGAGVIGTAIGIGMGKNLTGAEARAATLGIQTGAAAGVTVGGLLGGDRRAVAAASVAGGILGFPIGVRYPGHTSYTMTAGDVEATGTTGLVGILAGGAITAGLDHASDAQISAILGGGYLAGVALGDAAFARRYDLTQSQANIMNIGALAGGLLGLAVPVLSDANADGPLPYAVAAGGALLGMTALASTFPKVGSRLSSLPEGRREAHRGATFSVTPSGLVGLASRAPGRHVLARWVF
jgi:hypothetical protein